MIRRNNTTENQNNGREWIDYPKSENVKVETEVKEKVNREIENRKSRKNNINFEKSKNKSLFFKTEKL